MEGVDYVNFSRFSEDIFRSRTPFQPIGMGRQEVKALLGLASSDREREGTGLILCLQILRVNIDWCQATVRV